MSISEARLRQLRDMIAAGTSDDFYDWPEWKRIRPVVFRLDNYECELCRQRHRVRAATIVHHVKHLRDRPDLALSVFDPDTKERQLIGLCRACHEEEHPERWGKQINPTAPAMTQERWD